MSQREEFIRLVHQRRHPITELCIAFGISEKTGHKWLSRFHREGVTGLADRSLAPHQIRLGIRPERIALGHPQQNGQHERMHKTLKAEATRPPSANLRDQQTRFDRFRREYNNVRPHEALGQREPSSYYTPSPRIFPARLGALEYPAHLEVRRVSKGMIAWQGRHLWLTKTLSGEDVSLEETDDDTWTISFGPLVLGTYHPPSHIFLPETYWRPNPAE